MTAELVIFDCDGVLVDSEPISIAVLLALIADGRRRHRRGDRLRALPRPQHGDDRGIARADDFGLVVTDRHLDAMRATIYERFRSELKPIPGIAEALAALSG